MDAVSESMAGHRLIQEQRSESPGGDAHYRQGGIEPVDFILSNNLPAWKAMAIKYVFRAGKKGDERVDIEKAIWWLQERLKRL